MILERWNLAALMTESDENNGVDFVEILEYLRHVTHVSLERYHMKGYNNSSVARSQSFVKLDIVEADHNHI